jgi:pyruvate-ferredoxin/flavodoxin oxidoreductase
LRKGGTLVIDGSGSADSLAGPLTPGALALVRGTGGTLYQTAAPDEEPPALREERIAGALVGVLIATGRLDSTRRKLVAAREQVLAELEDGERTSRVEAFGAGFDSVTLIEIKGEAVRRAGSSPTPSAVAHLRARHKGAEQAADSLPRFWNQVGVLYEQPNQIAPTLSPDPYLAAGVVPPLSATLRGARDAATMLPRFVPEACTGCAKCWLECPDGAIAPAAYRPVALLEAGTGLAKKASGGGGADALRPMISKLAPLVNQFLVANAESPTVAKPLFEQACGAALDSAPLPEDRKKAVIDGFAAALAALGDLPLARTESLFDSLETAGAGAGALLTIAIDPNACKGCGACVSACVDDALVAEEPTPERVAAAAATWGRWQQLPDTAGDTIDALRKPARLGDLAALMLSRHIAFTAAGADGAEPGSGAKIALRSVLAAAEFQLQRRLKEQVDQVAASRQRVAERVQSTLSKALPTGDLSELGRRLDSVSTSAADLGQLSAAGEGVDVARTKRLVQVAQDLEALQERLAVGPFGLGRARLGLVMAPDSLTEGIAAFPYNPFQIPTVVDISGEAAALARGALEGQIRAVAADLAVVRRAELALESPTRAQLEEAELAQLGWSGLTDSERAVCPPLILVGGSGSFTDRALSRLLDADLPAVAVLLSGGAGDGDEAHWSGRTALGALAFGLSNPNVFVLQSSIAFPDHLGRGLMRAFAHRGPVLIHLHAPSPAHHGFPTDAAVAQARLAVVSRTFPLFVFDPAADGVFGTHVSLDGNPDVAETWSRTEDGHAITPATWAATEGRFSGWFSSEGVAARGPKPVDEFLALDARGRSSATPVIVGEHGTRAITPEAVNVCERRQREWRVLCELAGLVTPFTERIRQESAANVADAHATELAEQSVRHAGEVSGLRDAYRSEAARQIRDRLMSLAGYGPREPQRDRE